MNRLFTLFAVLGLSSILSCSGVGESLRLNSAPSAPFSAPRQDAWTVIGPGGGGSQFTVTISPHDPQTVVVRCDMTGAYITHDGGKSWRMFNLRSPIRFFAFDPHDAKTIYAHSIGLFRSTDAGTTWELVDPQPATVTGIASSGDHARDAFVTGTGEDRLHNQLLAMALDPCSPGVLFGARSEAGGSALVVSKDSGASWSRLGQVSDRVLKLFANPRCGGVTDVFAVGERSVSRVTPEGVELLPVAENIQHINDVSAGFAEGSAVPVFYAVADTVEGEAQNPGQLLVSRDLGKSWQNALPLFADGSMKGDSGPMFVAVATCRSDPSTAYASFQDLKKADADYFGIARTSDGGASWQAPIYDSNTSPSPKVIDSWISRRFGRAWGGNPFSLGVAPTDPKICYGTDWGRTMRSLNGMETWEAVYSQETAPDYFSTRGLDVTTNYGVHFDPFDPDRIFISYTDIGLFRSEDGGTSWTPSTMAGVPRRWVNTTYWVELDPKVQGRMWAVMSGVHDLPRPKMWLRQPVATFNGGVLRSDDGGESWAVQDNGIPQTAATHVLLDPESPEGARVLYVAGFGTGVYKSTDGGESWQLKNQGLEGDEPFAWRFHRDREGTLYLVVARRSTDDSVGGPGDGALYRSEDGAETWERLPLPEGLNGPVELASDPDDANRLYLAAWGRNTTDSEKQGGFWISTDRGKTWRNTLSRNQHLYSVTVDPKNPDVLYTCGFESSAWRSTDRGETWKRIKGFNFKWGHRVVPDPRTEDRIYITTFGGSVWYGPAEGDPLAVEDITTPQAAY